MRCAATSRSSCPATTSSSGAAASARSSSSSRRSSSFSAAAARRCAARARSTCCAQLARRRMGQRGGGRRSRARLCVPAPGRASPADGRRRADAAPAVRARGARRASPNSAATRGSTASRRDLTRHLSAGREALCAAVRGRAGARARRGQSRLHRRRRRSRDARRPCARSASSSPEAAAETDSRLAFRPPRRGAQRARARSADRTDAGAARSLRRLGRRRRGACRLRRGAGADAGGGRAVVDPALQRRRCANCSATCSAARPRLAQVIATRPHVLDAAIDPARERRFRAEPRRRRDARAGRGLHRPGAEPTRRR